MHVVKLAYLPDRPRKDWRSLKLGIVWLAVDEIGRVEKYVVICERNEASW